MSNSQGNITLKPLLRGHFHQAGFFIALGACAMLIARSHSETSIKVAIIYSLSLCGLFGMSALYHRPQWGPNARLLMKKLDHSAIYILIAGTMTPICLIAIPDIGGMDLLIKVWIGALLGILKSFFWVKAPKWLSALLYITLGWLAAPYIPEMNAQLGSTNVILIIIGGVIYSLGALIYATKKPNPWPEYFGYHEIFHIMVIIAGAFHFIVINSLIN